MARTVWSGSLSFGLVNLPVAMAAATGSHTVHFHQLERGTSDRVRNKRVNERTGKEVPYDKIVKGYPAGDGDDGYVVVEPEELDDIAPGRSRTIDVAGFAALEDIDPVYFDATYYLQPRKDADSKTYAVLRDTLKRTGRAGIATMSMRQKEHLVAVHAEDDVLVLHTLHWADEVREPRDTLDRLPDGSKASAKEHRMAEQLVDTMAIDFDPRDYRDRTQERVEELISAKRDGGTVEKAAEAPEDTNVVDLTATLQRSVESARQRRGGGRTRKDGSGLERLTKSELYRRASEAGISGRSKMNRKELLRALRAADTRKAS
ncbi:Ku protein [Streptomyces sp. A7024]|uniref:Non-homologous end joining protein Ku n=1 Tax=Streptomyces coryli TaxID=1128680 RepID=A0A6G4U0J2_9ACTN|nr:Ku protein [Streptomyces coryli]NGN65512.1 Ku protein [Streptomyces coryli]